MFDFLRIKFLCLCYHSREDEKLLNGEMWIPISRLASVCDWQARLGLPTAPLPIYQGRYRVNQDSNGALVPSPGAQGRARYPNQFGPGRRTSIKLTRQTRQRRYRLHTLKQHRPLPCLPRVIPWKLVTVSCHSCGRNNGSTIDYLLQFELTITFSVQSKSFSQ